ncbi:hypothetical protein P4679_27050 [Priestia megaterium]|uniref:hypothetical protein n=1 Tax=Priestia megaterium TaxID=1404 RepID=UPI002E225DA2|nr:hypothetical protein [Priestia megaterium]
MSEPNNIREIVRDEIELYNKKLNEEKEAERREKDEILLIKAFKANFPAHTQALLLLWFLHFC